MNDKYKELRELCDKATPGPWYWSDDRFTGGYSGLFEVDDHPVIPLQSMNDGDTGRAWIGTDESYYGDEAITEANARYIIAANPATIRALLAERDALVEALESTQAIMEENIPKLIYMGRDGLFMAEAFNVQYPKNSAAIEAAKRQEGV